jgi:hypothetical protein
MTAAQICTLSAGSPLETVLRSPTPATGWQRDLSVSHAKLAVAFRTGGEKAKALEALRQGLVIMVRMTALSPDDAIWKKDLVRFDLQIMELSPRAGAGVPADKGRGHGLLPLGSTKPPGDRASRKCSSTDLQLYGIFFN